MVGSEWRKWGRNWAKGHGISGIWRDNFADEAEAAAALCRDSRVGVAEALGRLADRLVATRGDITNEPRSFYGTGSPRIEYDASGQVPVGATSPTSINGNVDEDDPAWMRECAQVANEDGG